MRGRPNSANAPVPESTRFAMAEGPAERSHTAMLGWQEPSRQKSGQWHRCGGPDPLPDALDAKDRERTEEG